MNYAKLRYAKVGIVSTFVAIVSLSLLIASAMQDESKLTLWTMFATMIIGAISSAIAGYNLTKMQDEN